MSLKDAEYLQVNQSIYSFANAYRSRMQAEGVEDRTELNLADRSTLMVLGQMAPTTARALSARMDINPGTISVYVQRLVEKGLAERARSKEDRRVWHLTLTPAGQSAYADTIQGTIDYTRQFLEPLSADEQRVFHQLLLRVVHQLGYPWGSVQ